MHRPTNEQGTPLNKGHFRCPRSEVALSTSLPSRRQEGERPLRAAWIVWICIETADSTASSSLLNSSKQPQAPHFMIPMKIRPMLFTSIPCMYISEGIKLHRTEEVIPKAMCGREKNSLLVFLSEVRRDFSLFTLPLLMAYQ